MDEKEDKKKKAKRKKVKINGQEYIPLHVKVRPYLDKNGNRQEYKTFYGKTLKECKEKADKFNADDRIKAKEMFFGELVEDYIKNTFLPSSKVKERSKQRYVDAYNNNMAEHKVTKRLITEIDYRCLQEAYNDMTCAASSVDAIHKLLQHFFALMEQEGICKDPTKSLVVPKADKKSKPGEIVVFTDEELEEEARGLPAAGLAAHFDHFTERGEQAKIDADNSVEAMMKTFSTPAFQISRESNPAIAALLDYTRENLIKTAGELGNSTFRERPYVRLNPRRNKTLISEDEDTLKATTSYPSTHSEIGWGLALLLVEIGPREAANDILGRGFEYGRSRVIAGYNYPSDVQTARLWASATLAHLHTVPEFQKLLQAAKDELNPKPSKKKKK